MPRGGGGRGRDGDRFHEESDVAVKNSGGEEHDDREEGGEKERAGHVAETKGTNGRFSEFLMTNT